MYRDGWGDEDRDFVAVFVRYVSGEAPAKVRRVCTIGGQAAGRRPRRLHLRPSLTWRNDQGQVIGDL